MEKIKALLTKTYPEEFIHRGPFKTLSLELIRNNEVSLHFMGFSHLSKTKSKNDKLNYLRQELQKAAVTLVDSEIFKNVEFISATSWIVTRGANIMKELGFNIETQVPKTNLSIYDKRKNHLADKYQQIEPGYATISKEKFLQMYLK